MLKPNSHVSKLLYCHILSLCWFIMRGTNVVIQWDLWCWLSEANNSPLCHLSAGETALLCWLNVNNIVNYSCVGWMLTFSWMLTLNIVNYNWIIRSNNIMVTRNWSDNGRLNEIIERSGDHGGKILFRL